MGVPVVLRVFPHRLLQKRQVLGAGFPGVGVVVQLHPGHRHHRPRLPLPHIGQHLVDRVGPAVAAAGVGFLNPEDDPFLPVGGKAPGIAVAGLAGARRPGLFQRFPPAGVEDLVEVGADADVRLLRHQLQRAVAGGVEPPGFDLPDRHLRPHRPEDGDGAVGGAGVQDDHPVGLRHRAHPPFRELLFVFGNRIDNNEHAVLPCMEWEGGSPSRRADDAASAGGDIPQPVDAQGYAVVEDGAALGDDLEGRGGGLDGNRD